MSNLRLWHTRGKREKKTKRKAGPLTRFLLAGDNRMGRIADRMAIKSEERKGKR